MTYISYSSRFCLVFPTLPNRKVSYFGYLFSLILSMNIFVVDHCDLQDPVILPFISDPINYLTLFVCHSDLYFMVQ